MALLLGPYILSLFLRFLFIKLELFRQCGDFFFYFIHTCRQIRKGLSWRLIVWHFISVVLQHFNSVPTFLTFDFQFSYFESIRFGLVFCFQSRLISWYWQRKTINIRDVMIFFMVSIYCKITIFDKKKFNSFVKNFCSDWNIAVLFE